MHKLIEMPKGKRIQDVLPQYAEVRYETAPIGTPCPVCPVCTKPFTAARKPRLKIKLYPNWLILPVVFQYRICGICAKQYRAGGSKRDAVLSSIERFFHGSEARE